MASRLPSLANKNYNSFALSTLEELETQFFAALEDDAIDSLFQFHSSWEQFQSQLEIVHLHLTPDTIESITKFASVMVTVSQSMADSTPFDAVERFKANLNVELTTSIRDASAAPLPVRGYISASLRWLKTNIHNPYPSRETRRSIAKSTSTAVKDVDAWFVDIRKRIGWSQLRHSRFSNRKAGIVDAATRFFNGSDPHRPLASIVESEFASIAATVDQLYYEKCADSTLASHLDESVRDFTPDLRQSLSQGKQKAHLMARRSKSSRHRLNPYPTPELSPTLPFKSLCTTGPPLLASSIASSSEKCRKRSRSPSSECPTDIEGEIRSAKRTRYSPIPTLLTPPSSCYPSPAASIIIDLTEPPTQAPVSLEVEPTGHTGKRKSTLSDTGIVRAPPPRESDSQPRTSSDPPPLSVSEILDQAAFCPPSPSAVPSATSCAFGPFDPFFSAFMNGGAPALGDTSSPLSLNIVDDVAPTNVHVEFDQSWLSSSADALVPSYDPYATSYNTNFDNFGGNLYGGSVEPFSSPLWYGDPPSQSLVSAPCSEGSTLTLTGQLNVSLPSQVDLHGVAPPSSHSPNYTPHSDPQTNKARELLELEARCATLRSELAAGRSGVSILP